MYKISCTVYGHDSDVRSVTPSPFSPTGIISGSRDQTARIWEPDSDGRGYHQIHCFEGHTNFVSSVAAAPASDENPEGLVITGSSDKLIRVYSPKSAKPLLQLEGHTDTVCALAVGKFNMLASGSWDKTAKVWVLNKDDATGNLEANNVLTMSGHEAAVWAVLLLQQGIMATGSADKTIKLWKAGVCVKTLTGHDDCVRSLVLVSACQFLSCANDATVRKWSTTGECLQVYYGHTSYVYSICMLPGETEFVTSGEDRSIRVWNIEKKEPVQNIALPAQSAWDVTVLENGDIITGLSDGTMRIFSRSAERIGRPQDIAAYEAELSSTKIAKAGNDLGDIDINSTPGFEALENPGKKDGEVKVVRNGEMVEAYQWDGTQSKWMKVGDVVGSEKGKKQYNGKEYDFVFDVDIQEGAPSLKLPYNLSEDPWLAAQKFIDDNDLSQDFLEQICTFILDNTKEARKNKPPPSSAGYADPFTGGGRYVPGVSDKSDATGQDPFTGSGRYVPGSPQTVTTNGGDPFTSGGRYIPDGEGSEITLGGGAAADPMLNPNRYIPGDDGEAMDTTAPAMPNLAAANEYFPKDGFITFENANVDAIFGKLKAFSSICGPLSEEEMEDLKMLTVQSEATNLNRVNLLWKVLSWPAENIFPALDILRLTCLRQPDTCSVLCTDGKKPSLLRDMLCMFVSSAGREKHISSNKLLSLRTLCNLFSCADGCAFLMESYKDIFKALSAGFSTGLTGEDLALAPFYGNKNVQIAAATVLLNYAVLLSTSSKSSLLSPVVHKLASIVRSDCVEVTIVHLVGGEENAEAEATFRYLVCLGTLLSGQDGGRHVKEANNLGALKVLQTVESTYPTVEKIRASAGLLATLLHSV